MAVSASEDLSIIRRTYDVIAWFIPHLNRLPKTHRFGLGDRLVGGLYEFLEGLIHARWSREKRTALEGLNARLDVLRYQTRLLRDLGAVDLRRYEFASARFTEIGSELGAWRKSVAARSAASPGAARSTAVTVGGRPSAAAVAVRPSASAAAGRSSAPVDTVTIPSRPAAPSVPMPSKPGVPSVTPQGA